MDKSQLRQYRMLLRERDELARKIEKLYQRIEQLPDVYDKVQASQDEFPFVEIHIPVKAKPPREAAQINHLIQLQEKRKAEAIRALIEIEEYIQTIEDSEDRQIFEMIFLDGMTYREVGEELHMDHSTIVKRVTRQLSPNSPK